LKDGRTSVGNENFSGRMSHMTGIEP